MGDKKGCLSLQLNYLILIFCFCLLYEQIHIRRELSMLKSGNRLPDTDGDVSSKLQNSNHLPETDGADKSFYYSDHDIAKLKVSSRNCKVI